MERSVYYLIHHLIIKRKFLELMNGSILFDIAVVTIDYSRATIVYRSLYKLTIYSRLGTQIVINRARLLKTAYD